jgi:5-methylcytosine-specific restriction endonuclease McrA
MIFYAFAELFPASFREHVDRLRHDARYCAEFQDSVKRLGDLWYQAPKWRMTVKLLRLIQPHCQLCGTTQTLEAHHKTYEHFGLEILYIEDLEMLCDRCHREQHGIVTPAIAAQLRLRFPSRHQFEQGVSNGANFVNR